MAVTLGLGPAWLPTNCAARRRMMSRSVGTECGYLPRAAVHLLTQPIVHRGPHRMRAILIVCPMPAVAIPPCCVCANLRVRAFDGGRALGYVFGNAHPIPHTCVCVSVAHVRVPWVA